MSEVHVVMLVLLLPVLWAQTEHDPSRSVPVYRNAELGLVPGAPGSRPGFGR